MIEKIIIFKWLRDYKITVKSIRYGNERLGIIKPNLTMDHVTVATKHYY